MLLFARAFPIRRAPHVRAFCAAHKANSDGPQDVWHRYIKPVWRVYRAYSIFVNAPLAVLATATSVANLYKWWNPKDYARWYLRWISAGAFREPPCKPVWVENASMTNIVRAALNEHPDEEQMTLISGMQQTGKTSTVLRECHVQRKWGFFVDLGGYKSDLEKITVYIMGSLVANDEVQHNAVQRAVRLFFPLPETTHVLTGFSQAFKAGGLVLVVDEVQKLANQHVLADGVVNDFCKASSHGAVILVASAYNVPQYLKMMTHVYSRTKVVYAPSATKEEMLPYAQARFGDQVAQKVVEAFDGAFGLLRWMDPKADVDASISKVRELHKEQISNSLELTENGMKAPDRAIRTGEAMVAAAKLAFAAGPIKPFDKGTLELAQAGAAKIESLESGEKRATWAAPVTESIMKELLCDEAIHAVMKERIENNLYSKFEQVVKNRCPPQQKAM